MDERFFLNRRESFFKIHGINVIKEHPFSLTRSVFAEFVRFRKTCMLKRICSISKNYTQKNIARYKRKQTRFHVNF